jgi:zinc protease
MPTVFEFTLDNGLAVLVLPVRSVPIVSVWVGYRVSSRDEREGSTGLSHWVEHMTFKRTPSFGPGEIFRRISRVGGTNNGFTSADSTVYHETLPSEHLSLALQIEAERMGAATFDPAEVESERGVILAERAGSENSPRYLLMEQFHAAAFQVHPYRWPVIGTTADLRRIRHTELLAHYRAFYSPRNAVLVIAGDVDAEDVRAQVADRFGGFAGNAISNESPPAEPEQCGERRVELRGVGGTPHLEVGYRVPEWGHPDWYPLYVADAVLSGGKGGGGVGSGRTARLYRALVASGLTVGASSTLRASRDPSLLRLHASPVAGADPDRVEAELHSVVEGLASDPPRAQELERAIRQVEAQFEYSQDGVSQRAQVLLSFHMREHWSARDRHLERIRAVSPAEVSSVAAVYLRPERRTVGWIHP